MSSSALLVPALGELARPTNGDILYEVVNGQIVELPPMGVFENNIAFLLATFMEQFARTQQLGRTGMELLFHLVPEQAQERRPDVAFVSYQRWPRNRGVPRTAAWEVVPDLAVEVVSPSNSAADVLAKTEEYFRAGVRLVWVVYPIQEVIYVYESFSRIRVVQRHDELDGSDVLPSFRLPLVDLFEHETEVTPPV